MCLCEVAAWCKKHGQTLWDKMVELYEKYGYFKEDLYTITLKGIDGSKQIGEMMDKLRKNPPAEFGDLKVIPGAVQDLPEPSPRSSFTWA